MQRSDEELIEAACQGDIESYRVLYERHYALAMGIARSCLPDIHLAEDAVQETFATACRSLATLRKTSRFPEWIGTICRRTASRIARMRAKESKSHLQSASQAQFVEHDSQETEEKTQDRSVRIRHALDQLPAAAREIIWLHYFSRLSYEQIATSLNTSTQSVQGRLRRARWMLAELLNQSEEERSHAP